MPTPYRKHFSHPAKRDAPDDMQAVTESVLAEIERVAGEVRDGQHVERGRLGILRLVYARVRWAARKRRAEIVNPPRFVQRIGDTIYVSNVVRPLPPGDPDSTGTGAIGDGRDQSG